jgi:hypothetical protein
VDQGQSEGSLARNAVRRPYTDNGALGTRYARKALGFVSTHSAVHLNHKSFRSMPPLLWDSTDLCSELRSIPRAHRKACCTVRFSWARVPTNGFILSSVQRRDRMLTAYKQRMVRGATAHVLR